MKVLFPACQGEHHEDNILRAGGSPAWQGSGTILLVDDEEAVRTISKTMLEQFGFKVLTAENGTEAVKILNRNSEEIVCILLDHTMPGMSGKQVFQEIRRILPDVKVVLCSGYSEEEATLNFQKGDLAGFLQKPYGFANMANKIRKVLES